MKIKSFSIIKKYIGSLFFTTRFYTVGGGIVFLFIASFFLPQLFMIAILSLAVFIFIVLADYVLLFFNPAPIVLRKTNSRLSNGDNHTVTLNIKNTAGLFFFIDIIDELPVQFQERNFVIKRKFAPQQKRTVTYELRPLSRGMHQFGNTILYTATKLKLLQRRHILPTEEAIPVYPAFQQLRKYQLIAKAALLNEPGGKRIRKVGNSMEFEQIKSYVTGDDIRNVNWKATARKSDLMVNNYVTEKSQQVYCIVDKGRLMKMPFNGLTLLDYAINSCLALTNVCLQKQDKIGVITFADKMGEVIAADKKMVQRDFIMQMLYKQQTAFLETDFEMLYLQVRHKIKQRSLLILYTNFESLHGLKRQLNYLRSIAKHHLLLVIFFENTELTKLSQADALTVEDIYIKTIADKFSFEKRLIVKELQQYGILSVLTSPENLTISAINKYLEIKNRQSL